MDDKDAFKIMKEILTLIQELFLIDDSDTIKEIERITALLWKRSVSDQLYTDTADSKKLYYNTTRVASFIVLIQLLVYHILQTHSPNIIQTPLNQLINSDDFSEKLADSISLHGRKNDHYILKEIFEYDLLKVLKISQNKKEKLIAAIDLITKSGFEQIKADVLGKIFHSLIPLEIRRKMAAFYSSNWAGRILSELSIQHPEDKVLDLTCGSGTLLVEAYHTKKALFQRSGQKLSDVEIHRSILNSLYGSDISIFATKLAQANLILQYPNDLSCSVNIISGDGLAIVPADNVSGFPSRNVFPKVDCIIMNPPFSRQRDMSESTIKHIENLLSSYGLGDYIDKKMGLHGYFILHADQFLKEGGFMSMIIPATTFNADYTEKILEFLRNRKYSIRFVFEILTKKNAFSEDCAFKEYMVILQKGMLKEDQNTALVSFLKEPTRDSIPTIISAIKNDIKTDEFEIKRVKTEIAYQNYKWRELFLKSEDSLAAIFENPYFKPYSNLKANIRIFRGFDATYADYVMIPNKWWKISKENSEFLELIKEKTEPNEANGVGNIKISKRYLVRAIRRTSTAEEIIIKPDSYVINLNPSIISKEAELKVIYEEYLKFMKRKIEEEWEKQKARGHKRVIVPESWYAHPNKHHCDRTIGHLFHFYKYAIKTRKTIVPYTHEPASIHFGFGYVVQTPNDPFYAAWFNSSLYLFSLFKNQQLFAKSFFKMTIENFHGIFLPDYSQFIDQNGQLQPRFNPIVEKYWAFANASDNDMPFIPDQLRTRFKPRVELDRAWLTAIGFKTEEIESCLDNLYAWLLDYIEKR